MVSFVGAQDNASHNRIYIVRMFESRRRSCVGRYSGSCMVTRMIVMFVLGRIAPKIQQFPDYVVSDLRNLPTKLISIINIIN